MTTVKTVKVRKEVFDEAVQKAVEALRWAKISLMRYHYPYLSPIASNSPFVTKAFFSETIAIDKHWRVYFNPFYILSFIRPDAKIRFDIDDLETFVKQVDPLDDIDIDSLVLLLRHEYEHVFRQHFARAEAVGRTGTSEWNIASDCEINQHFPDDIHPSLEGMVRPQVLGLENGLSAEEYLYRLPKNAVQQIFGGRGNGVMIEVEGGGNFMGNGFGSDKGSGTGMPVDCELNDNDSEYPAKSEAQKRVTLEQTAREILNEKNRGTVPADLIRMAEELLKEKIDWRKVFAGLLRKQLSRVSSEKSDYSWSAPNRRQEVTKPFILPALVEYEPSRIAVVIDTSGSMSSHELSQCVSETLAIIRKANCSVDIYACDAAVAAVKKNVRGRNEIVQSLRGGGGTDMRVGIEEALSSKPDCIVVMTDGYTPFPDEPTPVPLIICLLYLGEYHGTQPPSWAKVVHINLGSD